MNENVGFNFSKLNEPPGETPSDTPEVERFESQNNIKVFGSNKTEGPKRGWKVTIFLIINIFQTFWKSDLTAPNSNRKIIERGKIGTSNS